MNNDAGNLVGHDIGALDPYHMNSERNRKAVAVGTFAGVLTAVAGVAMGLVAHFALGQNGLTSAYIALGSAGVPAVIGAGGIIYIMRQPTEGREVLDTEKFTKQEKEWICEAVRKVQSAGGDVPVLSFAPVIGEFASLNYSAQEIRGYMGKMEQNEANLQKVTEFRNDFVIYKDRVLEQCNESVAHHLRPMMREMADAIALGYTEGGDDVN